MPSLDAGHYFLTVLAPIRPDTQAVPARPARGGAATAAPMRADLDPNAATAPRSHRQLLAQDLALLRTGYQTSSSDPEGPSSPFAHNTLNHLARFVIIDGPPYNGRIPGDTIVDTLLGRDPLIAQPVDSLNSAYLLFAADIDARAPGDPVAAYAEALWSTMARELRVVFSHCVDFGRVSDGASLAAWLRRCEVETTMPFNDYWPDMLQAPPAPKAQALALLAVAAVGTVAAGVMVGWWAAALVLVAALWVAYAFVLNRGARSYPTAPTSDLPSVLKALYIKETFTQFAIAAQGDDEAALHARFGDFLARRQPGAPTPTQAPGRPGAT